jgi:hypothetical protein
MHTFANSFDGQRPNEQLFVFARPYWTAYLWPSLTLIPLLILTWIAQLGLSVSSLPAQVIQGAILLVGALQIFMLLVLIIVFLDIYHDLIIVTDRRVVDIDQAQLFSRKISELSLEDVQDATSTVSGILPTLFGYGTVLIQTSSAEKQFEVPFLKNPREVAAIILELAEQASANVLPQDRVPRGATLAMINHEAITSPEVLQKIGVVVQDGLRRFRGIPKRP